MKNLSQAQNWQLNTDNFITEIIQQDLAAGKNGGQVVTRFPPEPNGYLHIGHAKSITLNFGLAARYKGRCNLRFDDTNPAKEEDEYVQSIIRDVTWLVGHSEFEVLYASDYFQTMYDFAVKLIQLGKAYVDFSSPEKISEMRGAPYRPGIESPYRNSTVEENLKHFEAMTRGEHPEGAAILRAKIDMSSPNLNLRDPALYRIKKAAHHRSGSRWVVYPMYDWAHGWEDSVEGITHSLCTLEFADHRPLYDWFLDQFPEVHHPRQYEFNRLSITYMVLSKRKLIDLVKEGHVKGWDDPRLPTLAGLRRRGYTPGAIRRFCEATGYTKTDGQVDLAMLEYFIREELNKTAPRVMAVLNPIPFTLINYPEGQSETVEVENNPEDPEGGSRSIPFGRHLWVAAEDWAEVPAKGWFRLAPGQEVRLKGAYVVKVEEVVKNPDGSVKELRGTYDPSTRSGQAGADARKVKGTIQWVSRDQGVPLEARLYDTLFSVENLAALPEEQDWRTALNPESLKSVPGFGEPLLAGFLPGQACQFLRLGYFVADADSRAGALVFNRTVGLRDTWAKVVKKEA